MGLNKFGNIITNSKTTITQVRQTARDTGLIILVITRFGMGGGVLLVKKITNSLINEGT